MSRLTALTINIDDETRAIIMIELSKFTLSDGSILNLMASLRTHLDQRTLWLCDDREVEEGVNRLLLELVSTNMMPISGIRSAVESLSAEVERHFKGLSESDRIEGRHIISCAVTEAIPQSMQQQVSNYLVKCRLRKPPLFAD